MIVREYNCMNKFGTAIILAGGKSSRMGFDKQFLEIDERRIMNDIIYKLEQQFNEIIIVTNKPEEYKEIKHKIITDIIIGKGPLSGIHAGLNESLSKYAFVVACDMPNINMDYVSYMRETISNKDIDGCVTKFNEYIETFNSFYSKDIVDKIEEYLMDDKRSINSFLRNLRIHYIEENKAREFSSDWIMFSNLNTKEDLEFYLKKHKR